MRLLVVPCGRAKLDHPAPARRLYTGAHFRFVLDRVEQAARGRGAAVRILSALHGLVDPEAELAPYDVTMTSPASVTAALLAGQLTEIGGLVAVTAYLPRAYLARLTAGAELLSPPLVVHNAYAGCRGIGEQRRVIANLARIGGA